MKMKSLNLRKAATVALFSVATLSVAYPSYGQAAVAPELAAKAKQACIDKAKADGFALKDVVSVDPYNGEADRVKVVLNLTKTADGTAARLTCGYSKDGKVAFGEDPAPPVAQTSPVQTTEPAKEGGFPWWLLLLPILGIPLLFTLFKGKEERPDAEVYERPVATRVGTQAVVRANSEYLDIHEGPGTTYRVTGTLRNGQRVALANGRDNNWAELETGGWVPLEYLDLDTTSYRQV
jgi:uncharacterized protein YgiM (DUF1202 family)